MARRASKHAGSMQVAQRCSIETRRLMTSEGVEAAEPKRHLTASHGEPETDPAHLPSVTRRGPAPARPPCTARARCPDGRRAVATDLLLLETTPRLSCHLMLSTPHSQCVYSCITLYRRSSNDQVISDRFTIETLKILNRILHRYTTGVPRAKPDCFILYKLGLPVHDGFMLYVHAALRRSKQHRVLARLRLASCACRYSSVRAGYTVYRYLTDMAFALGHTPRRHRSLSLPAPTLIIVRCARPKCKCMCTLAAN